MASKLYSEKSYPRIWILTHDDRIIIWAAQWNRCIEEWAWSGKQRRCSDQSGFVRNISWQCHECGIWTTLTLLDCWS